MAAEPSVDAVVSGAVERLSSNVMNYLVWRYLQESGYGKTAKQLQYQWMGKEQSPETLPFACHVKKACLIHLAQDGLMLDQLQAEVKKMNRQYHFGPDHGRKFSIPAEEPSREKKSRRRSVSRGQGNMDRETMQNGSPADPPARRGKGKRKSGGNDKRVNGEAMDVDNLTNNASANDIAITDAGSPTPAVEDLPAIVSTLDIGESKGTITEVPRDLTQTTSFVGLEENVLLEQVTWSPHNRTALITAGRNHMRVFKIPSSNELIPQNNTYSRSTKVDIPALDYDVQAFAWTEKGSGAFTTLEKVQDQHGDEHRSYKMLGFTEYGQKVNVVDQSAGWVLSMKYNPESELLVALSWGEPSHIKVWQYGEIIFENSKRRVEPSFEFRASLAIDAKIYAVEWTAPNRFVVCGNHTISHYEVHDDSIQLIKSVPTEGQWTKLEYDPVYDILVVQDINLQTLMILHPEDGARQLHGFPDQITDFAFQPLEARLEPEAEQQRILAASSDDGHIYLFDALNLTLPCIHKLEMGYNTAPQRIAFSPDGFLLAAAGYDTVNVWKTSESARPKCVWRMPEGSSDRWRCGSGNNEKGSLHDSDDEDGGEEDRFVHMLGWDADGKRIAFGLNGQVAIIRL